MSVEDKREILDIIERGLRGHFPPNHRGRFAVETSVPTPTTTNGDQDGPPEEKHLDNAISAFRAMTVQDQATALNGWNPDILKVDRATFDSEAMNTAIYPALRLGRHREFSAVVADRPETCIISIRAGSSKVEVLDALAALTRRIDQEWDHLISDPEPVYR